MATNFLGAPQTFQAGATPDALGGFFVGSQQPQAPQPGPQAAPRAQGLFGGGFISSILNNPQALQMVQQTINTGDVIKDFGGLPQASTPSVNAFTAQEPSKPRSIGRSIASTVGNIAPQTNFGGGTQGPVVNTIGPAALGAGAGPSNVIPGVGFVGSLQSPAHDAFLRRNFGPQGNGGR